MPTRASSACALLAALLLSMAPSCRARVPTLLFEPAAELPLLRLPPLAVGVGGPPAPEPAAETRLLVPQRLQPVVQGERLQHLGGSFSDRLTVMCNSCAFCTPLHAAPAGGGAPGAAPALLILLPGALLSPNDSAGILEALQTAQQRVPGLALWAAAAAVDWARFNPAAPAATLALGDAAAQAALDAAVRQGFPLQTSAKGDQLLNVFISMHSLASLFASGLPLRRAAGAALLGATLQPFDPGFWPSPHAFPKPLLHVFGQLDGQQTTPQAALAAGDAARGVPTLGPRENARQKPVALVPGLSHAQMNNGVPNVARGDLLPDASLDQARAEVARVLAAFVAANLPAPGCGGAAAEQAALDALQEATRRAAALLSPYLEALGRATPEQLLAPGAPGDAQLPALAAAYGAELFPAPPSTTRAQVAHPGELAEAERFCAAVQARVLRGAGLGAAVAFNASAVAHTDRASFDAARAAVVHAAAGGAGGGGTGTVQAHCYLYREGLESTAVPSRPVAPVYFLKALNPAANRTAVAAAEVNAATWCQAKAAAPQPVLDMFQRRGAELIWAPDA
jgi:hypothetical protein